MQNIFQEEHRIFRKNLRAFVQKEINPIAEECEERQEFPKQILPKLGELGYLGLNFPTKYGGTEADVLMNVVFVSWMCPKNIKAIGNISIRFTIAWKMAVWRPCYMISCMPESLRLT